MTDYQHLEDADEYGDVIGIMCARFEEVLKCSVTDFMYSLCHGDTLCVMIDMIGG